MKRVTALGGIFFKSKKPVELKKWYNRHLGLNADEYGAIFKFRDFDNPNDEKYSVWSSFSRVTEYFNPSEKEYMVNFTVYDLEKLILALKDEGIEILGSIDDNEFGKFAWILDPEGTKIELWEPKSLE